MPIRYITKEKAMPRKSKWNLRTAIDAVSTGQTLRELQASGKSGAINYLYRHDPQILRDLGFNKRTRKLTTVEEAVQRAELYQNVRDFHRNESHAYQILVSRKPHIIKDLFKDTYGKHGNG